MDNTNDWTLMFFFAGDNSLAPSMVSQLKAIKDAGFQEKTTVLVRYDPSEKGAPTNIFEVNREQKLRGVRTRIGDGANPYVASLQEDNVTQEDIAGSRGDSAKDIKKELKKPDTLKADKALESFLGFCRDNHPAKHYMLFLVGHGLIVGNDAFLPDDRPDSAITLKRLGEILGHFGEAVRGDKSYFDLVAMHSCSMSALEVAYELRGTADYLMATEGVSFVGSWPYRQLLKKTFNTIEKAGRAKTGVNVRELLKKLYYLCINNSTDFTFAGFSADLCLCDLNAKKVEELNVPIKDLTKQLKLALKEHPGGLEVILLAHLKSQSYWQESYTDLFDFCACLIEACSESDTLKPLKDACETVMEKLDPLQEKSADPFEKLVVYSDFIGPVYQYSHGLSVYFPWSRPIGDGVNDVMGKYRRYAFTTVLGKDDSWLSFLEAYFIATTRTSRKNEDGERLKAKTFLKAQRTAIDNAQIELNSVFFAGADALSGPDGKPSPSMAKTTPADAGGGDCGCPSIKNYPGRIPLSAGATKAFPSSHSKAFPYVQSKADRKKGAKGTGK